MEAKSDWKRVVEFHGHACPGLAIGYRVAKAALRELSGRRAEDEELVAIVENDACGVDAIQVLTGCTIGKGNLIYRDYGKHVFTFGCRRTGKALRISVKGSVWQRRDPEEEAEYRRLRAKVFGGEATEEEKARFYSFQQRKTEEILSLPEEELFNMQWVDMELPPRARIFNSVTCAFCGEPVAEVRARIREGKPACIPCSLEYSRGW
ncbi:FmdE family protein [Ammonifex thiophilus]|uniref:Formylmethanofuran dehydrogenase n=1 Tax=Ammonifex thiophilus TaxID=444093 RepID=A0A3D8P2W8_9THEO|nr:FmdE family protein [Ammonifex thiophilus]RDV80181.1 formylmethanofuran dehydrogenase [Ammonifex thiophilus]